MKRHEIEIQIGDTGVFLHELSPRLNSKYSPNLYKWLRRNSDVLHDVFLATDRDGYQRLCVGSADEDWPFTCLLWSVLCNGPNSKLSCCAGSDREHLVEVKGFFESYKKLGRCAIDPDHETTFIDSDRWEYSEDRSTRSCKWCGEVTQKLILRERTVVDECWEAPEMKNETEEITKAIDGADTLIKWMTDPDYIEIVKTIKDAAGVNIGAAVIARKTSEWFHRAGIWVAEDHRGKGHGSALAKLINEECSKTGIRVFLSARDDTGRAAFAHIDKANKIFAAEISMRSCDRNALAEAEAKMGAK